MGFKKKFIENRVKFKDWTYLFFRVFGGGNVGGREGLVLMSGVEMGFLNI